MRRLWALALACAAVTGVAAAGTDDPQQAVARVLDDWHRAAAEADEGRYFAYFAPGAVFLGTDASERWTVEEFREYAHPHFSAGRGWSYLPRERHIMFADDGKLAWFDEKLTNDKYGELRGTGVLGKISGEWKLQHYSLTFTVPNDSTTAVVAAIRGADPG